MISGNPTDAAPLLMASDRCLNAAKVPSPTNVIVM